MSPATRPSNPLRVLLVDDESLIRRAVRRVFAGMDHVAIEDFDCGSIAVTRAREAAFDVALLDLQMPTMTGIELARQLRELSPELRIVFMTANPLSDLAAEAWKMVGSPALSKPWDTEDLVRAVVGPIPA